MFIITLIFLSLFWQEIACWWAIADYKGDVEPTPQWKENYQERFDQIGATNFSISAAHILHGLTIEDARTFFNIKMPNNNGIPAGNPDLKADESSGVLANVPSRPNEYSSPGMYGFVDFMDHVTDPDWMVRGSKLHRLLHVFHMQECLHRARKRANDFTEVSDDICIGALDHKNNGIEKGIAIFFKAFKSESEKSEISETLTWDDNGQSWAAYKLGVDSSITNSMGLYIQCLMRKFRTSEQPIELDSCCESKTVGDYTYTLISAGKVLSKCPDSCIYTRKDQNGSQYCFAKGDLKVQCLR